MEPETVKQLTIKNVLFSSLGGKQMSTRLIFQKKPKVAVAFTFGNTGSFEMIIGLKQGLPCIWRQILANHQTIGHMV